MLTVVATPIGNLADMSPRGVESLREADGVACEDTRRTRALLSHFGIPRPQWFVSYRQGKEEQAGRRLMELLRGGKRIALCSDGGYPGISDPGYRLIREAIREKIPIEVIPGAGAVAVALVLSGLSTASYTFKGYPPRRPGPLRRFFEEDCDRPHTLILFEAPPRVHKTLAAAYEVLGDREVAVCVELTKRFEKTHRGYLADLAPRFAQTPPRGEVTIVIAGNNPKFCRS